VPAVNPRRRVGGLTSTPAGPAQRQRGLTLIEILVAVLVIAIGLLGVAGLQASSLKANRTAYGRTQASVLAYDIADRMRLSQAAARRGEFDNDFSDDGASQSASHLVTNQVEDWLDRLEANLPAAEGQIETGSTCGRCVTIKVRWQKRDDTSATVSFKYETRI